MNPRTVSARDLETMVDDGDEIELPGPEGGWATAVINGREYRARVAPAAVAERALLGEEPVKCRCACHRSDSVSHFAPCCCVHRYKSNCPTCMRALREALTKGGAS